jgi:hypothetical protein
MSEEFDLTKLTEGMSPAEAMEFVQSVLTPEAKQAFVAKRKTNQLQAQYQKEINSLDTRGLPMQIRIKRMTEIKKKYRRQGLEVY